MIEAFSLWAPGLKTKADWLLWAEEEKQIDDSAESPKLEFASPIATRRFSQLTKMTCWMAHRIGLDADILFFTSVRGEIDMQYKLNDAFAREGETKPAPFSLSTFNTAPAQATILLGPQIPYTPLYSGFDNAIRNLLLAGTAPLKSGRLNSAVLIYAEERVPDAYRDNLQAPVFPPLCIGVKISNKRTGTTNATNATNGGDVRDAFDFPQEASAKPGAFARHLIEHHADVWIEGYAQN